MPENQGDKRDVEFLIQKLEDEIDELRRVVRDLSNETTKIVAATVDISAKLTEFVVKNEYLYKSITELISLLKAAAERGEEDPLVKSIKELNEKLKDIEILLRKIYTRIAIAGVKIKKE